MPRNVEPRPATSIPVEATRHTGDHRANIPTAELESFAAADETRPEDHALPARPVARPAARLEGQGRAGRDDLAVPAVPIYIQEKIQPAGAHRGPARHVRKAEREPAARPLRRLQRPRRFEEQVDFYRHPSNWSNRMILGDSLLVMTSLAEKEGLKGQVQTIYIDPPYGIKFGTNWQVSTRKRDVKDGKAEDATRQPEQVRAFRDTWELGIHSYLAYLRDRLVGRPRAAHRDRQRSSCRSATRTCIWCGACWTRCSAPRTSCAMIAFQKTQLAVQSDDLLPASLDYLLWYREGSRARRSTASSSEPRTSAATEAAQYTLRRAADGTSPALTRRGASRTSAAPDGARVYRLDNLTSPGVAATGQTDSCSRSTLDGRAFPPGTNVGGRPTSRA